MAESWSIEEEKQLQALMAKKVVAVNESRGAAMSDGSKRRYVDEESVGSMDNPWIEVREEPPQGGLHQCGAGFANGHYQHGAMGPHGHLLRQVRRSKCDLQ